MGTCHTMSGLVVYIRPEDLWEFFMANRSKLHQEMCCVAENTDTGYELRLDIEGDYPVLRIFYKGEAEKGEYIATSKEAPTVMRRLVLTHLCPVIEESDIQDDSPPADDGDIEYDETDMDVLQAMIDMREEELDVATDDFLRALFNGPVDARCPDDLNEAILDSVCKVLARRFKVSVFRPTWVPQGEQEVYEEYPYLDTEQRGVIVVDPSSYEDAMVYADAKADEAAWADADDDDLPDLSDFPVT